VSVRRWTGVGDASRDQLAVFVAEIKETERARSPLIFIIEFEE